MLGKVDLSISYNLQGVHKKKLDNYYFKSEIIYKYQVFLY